MLSQKKTKGRQKIEMKKIQSDDDRMITFSKRRSGINKKLSELVTLCGAQVGFLIFSSAGRPFTFGHPCFESIANQFANQNVLEDNSTLSLVEAHKRLHIDDLNTQCNQLIERLEIENLHGKALSELQGTNMDGKWWQYEINKLGPEELKQLYDMFGDLHENLCSRILQKRDEASTSDANNDIPIINMSKDEAGLPPLLQKSKSLEELKEEKDQDRALLKN